MKLKLLALCGAGALSLSACTTADLEMLNAALAQTNYEMQRTNQQMYNTNGYSGVYNNGYANAYGNSQIVNSIGNNYVGYNGCQHTGRTYACDTNGDGYADMHGNASTGSYSSSHLRVNEYGEAYVRGANGQWVREPSYDRQPRNSGYNTDRYNSGHYRKQ